MTSHRLMTAIGLVAVAAFVTGCGHADVGETGSAPPVGQSTTTTSPSKTAPGVFGTAGKICGPGNAKGKTERGVSDNQITIGNFSDAGASLSPGLGKENWETADGFVKWCNEAGG